MAVKKRKDRPEQGLNIDPAVQAYLSGGAQAEVNARRVAAMDLSQAQRRKRARDKARNRCYYDLPMDIGDRIAEIADEYGIPKSQLVAFLLDIAIRALDAGMDLRPYLRPSRVPRFEWFLALPEDEQVEITLKGNSGVERNWTGGWNGWNEG